MWPDVLIKSCPKAKHSSFTYKVTFSQIEQKVAKYLDYFCKKICHQGLTKIAQSGHSACNFAPSIFCIVTSANLFRANWTRWKRIKI